MYIYIYTQHGHLIHRLHFSEAHLPAVAGGAAHGPGLPGAPGAVHAQSGAVVHRAGRHLRHGPLLTDLTHDSRGKPGGEPPGGSIRFGGVVFFSVVATLCALGQRLGRFLALICAPQTAPCSCCARLMRRSGSTNAASNSSSTLSVPGLLQKRDQICAALRLGSGEFWGIPFPEKAHIGTMEKVALAFQQGDPPECSQSKSKLAVILSIAHMGDHVPPCKIRWVALAGGP